MVFVVKSHMYPEVCWCNVMQFRPTPRHPQTMFGTSTRQCRVDSDCDNPAPRRSIIRPFAAVGFAHLQGCSQHTREEGKMARFTRMDARIYPILNCIRITHPQKSKVSPKISRFVRFLRRIKRPAQHLGLRLFLLAGTQFFRQLLQWLDGAWLVS